MKFLNVTNSIFGATRKKTSFLGDLVDFKIFTKLKIYNLKPTLQVINLKLSEYNLVLVVEHVQEIITQKKCEIVYKSLFKIFLHLWV
jgi:hypothetical protein